jgi:hypothetical protein
LTKDAKKMFNLKLEEINFDRIKAFCDQKVPEGESIEYKVKAENEDYARIISSMANTYGGILLIGVEADKKNNIPISLPGIEFEKGLEEKITSICLGSIYHPVFPEVKACGFTNKDGKEKAILFIRVYESDHTLHAINNNTDVYIRIKSQTKPFERKARQEEADWLRNRRTKAVELRERLVDRARSRYMYYTRVDAGTKNHYTEVYVSPLFPAKPLFSVINFSDSFKRLKNSTDEEKLKEEFQIFLDDSKTATDSLYFFESFDGEITGTKYIFYTEFNTFGIVYRNNSPWERAFHGSQSAFDVITFLRQLYQTLREALLLYKDVGYLGLLRVGITVKGLRYKEICTIDPRRGELRLRYWAKNELDDEFELEKNVLFHEFEEKFDSLCLDIYKHFLWTCGAGKELLNLERLKQAEAEYQMAKNYFKKS